MKQNIHQKLMTIASLCLTGAGTLFLCLSLLGYEKGWTLPAALGCVTLSLLFQVIFPRQSK